MMLVTVTTLSEYETFYLHFQDKTSSIVLSIVPPRARDLEQKQKLILEMFIWAQLSIKLVGGIIYVCCKIR